MIITPVDASVGLTADATVTAKYQPAETGYSINVYTQEPNGTYVYAETITSENLKHAFPGTQIPIKDDLDAIKSEYEAEGVYFLETYNTAQITQDGSASVEVVFGRNIVSMSFKPNGGMNAPDTIYGRIGQDVPVSSILPPSRAGYTFIGWKENEGTSAGPLPDKFPEYSSTYTAEWAPPQDGDLRDVHIVY